MWEYVKGSEADFEGAPDWATLRTYCGGRSFYAEHHEQGAKIYDICAKDILTFNNEFVDVSLISVTAERRKVENLQQTLQADNKYNRQCKGVTIDVYDVLLAFNVTNPALQHLVKKALCTGLRGHKDKTQDLQEIVDSAKRAVELEGDK